MSVGEKPLRFGWRASRNLLCVLPVTRRFLFRPENMASCFGSDDADYAITVFLHHYRQLSEAGFRTAGRILEVGPGRNVGTSLLIWALNHARSGENVIVILWDVFPNMVVNADTLRESARTLIASALFQDVLGALPEEAMDQTLGMVARGDLLPDIRYRVQPFAKLVGSGDANDISLVYSHAAIEHIWRIEDCWSAIIGVTRPGGWHSHRIDLADHGRRATNYIEMLEWSALGYWLTMRFVPGAINRWRASMHVDFLVKSGLKIFSINRETRDALPIPRSRIDREFRSLDELDLRTTAVDLVAARAT